MRADGKGIRLPPVLLLPFLLRQQLPLRSMGSLRLRLCKVLLDLAMKLHEAL